MEPNTPFEYREARPEAHFRLVTASLRVELVADQSARFRFDCELETLGGNPAEMWFHDVPAKASEVTDLVASDGAGNLQARISSGSGGTALLEVRLGEPVLKGERYKFSFGYVTGIRSVVSVRALSRVVAYSDWHIFNVPCDVFSVDIRLPKRSAFLRAVPVADVDGDSVRYSVKRLRSGEAVQYLVGYQRRQIGSPFYQWVASTVGSGLVGAFIAHYFEALFRR